jgi:hypothetical protein
MSWRQYVRAVEAENRRRQRESARVQRELVREQRRQEKHDRERAAAEAKLLAANEAEQFETYLVNLVSLHHECPSACDWKAILAAQPPPPATRGDGQEVAARAALASYRPSLLERLSGGARRRRAELERLVTDGRTADDREFDAARERHRSECASVAASKTLAARVLSRDCAAYKDALSSAGALEDLVAFGTATRIDGVEQDVVAIGCTLDDEIVPREEVKLSSSGKLTTKEMASGRFWTLYQDHVCSAALRIAREVFEVLPVSRVVVNIQGRQLDTTTGHMEPVTLLAVNIPRERLGVLNLEQLDPSDSMKNFQHRMKFKKTAGFTPVDAMTLDENWITT